jgi:hypothetical protein
VGLIPHWVNAEMGGRKPIGDRLEGADTQRGYATL